MIVSSVSASGTSLPRRKVDFDCNVFSVIAQIFACGDIFTKLSFLIFGLSNLVRGQIIKGLIFLGTEVAFFENGIIMKDSDQINDNCTVCWIDKKGNKNDELKVIIKE